MRFAKEINLAVVAAFAVLIILIAPIASAVNSHDCCPPRGGEATVNSTHDLVSHYQHTVQMNHDGLMHNLDTADGSVDVPCDFSCCVSFASSDNFLTPPIAVASWNSADLHFRPGSNVGFSASQHLHTPPPRTSLII